MKQIKCTIDRVIYGSDNYAVLSCRVHDCEDIPKDAIKGYSTEEPMVTVVGNDLPTEKDVEIEVDGNWTLSSYGMQFKAVSVMETLPVKRNAIIAYLSKEIPGVGKVTAGELYKKYGADVFSALDADFTGVITSVKRIRSEQRLAKMKEEWELKQTSRKLIAKLMRYGIKPQKALMIRKVFGDLAEGIVENDPYQLCSVSGFGFLSVDAIAK